MLHTLIEAGRLTRDEAIEAVDVAIEIKAEKAEEFGETAWWMRESLAVLRRIERSLASMGEPTR